MNSEAAAPATERRAWTPAERKRAVKAYKNRGDRPVREVAAEHGVSQPVLYYWIKQDAEGTLNATPGKRPSKAPSTAITTSRPVAVERHRAEQLELGPIVVTSTSRSTSTLSSAERDELVLLRAEVRKLKRALIAYAELEEGRR